MSDRQIAATVRFGRLQSPFLAGRATLAEITGYLAGMDRYSYFVLVPGRGGDDPPMRKFLVHKSGTLIELHDESALDNEVEEIRQELRKIITPFRTKIMEDYYPDVQRHTGRQSE